jgi:GDP-L-fucose synthase
MASACYHVMKLGRAMFEAALKSDNDARHFGASRSTSPISFLNIGTGIDCTISEVAEIIREVVGFKGETRYNSNQPDGTPRKLLDTSRITSLGCQPSFSLRQGLQDAYQWYCSQLESI